MKLETLLLAAALAGTAQGQELSPQAAAKARFGLIATRAVAQFRSADSIEERLRAQGAVLHPQLITLRLRIERGLDDVQDALDKGDLERAGRSMDVASELVGRFARQMGGS